MATSARSYNAAAAGSLWDFGSLPESFRAFAPDSAGFALRVESFQRSAGLVPDGKLGPATLAAVRAAFAPPAPTTPAETLSGVGAWSYSAMLSGKGLAAGVKAVRGLKLTDLYMTVNDNTGRRIDGAWKQRRDFHLFRPSAEIVKAIRAYRDAGVRVHVMTWIMPQVSFTQEMSVLADLCSEGGATSLLLDAEEPWTSSGFRGDWNEAASRVFAALSGMSVPIGATVIPLHSVKKAGPIVRGSTYVLPQGYSTNRYGPEPGQSPHPRYYPGPMQTLAVEKVKAYGLPIVMGLAAWNQDGAGGLGIKAAMRAAVTATLAQGVSQVAYWWMPTIEASRTIADVVRSLSPGA